MPTDVSQEEQIEAAFTTIRREFGTEEVLLYNTAMRPFGRLLETKASTFENTWHVCVFGAFLCGSVSRTDMLTKGKGSVLFPGATAGVKPFPTSAAFGPAKFAMRGLAQVLARDLGPRGITWLISTWTRGRSTCHLFASGFLT